MTSHDDDTSRIACVTRNADLNNSSLPCKVLKWFNCYLKGRQSRTIFQNFQFFSCNIHTGVPQGAVTSPKLFNFYLYHLPQPPVGAKVVVLYVDDLSVYDMGPDIQILGDEVNSYVPTLLQFFKERDLIVSPEKSTVTLFTPQPNQSREHPQILINGTFVPLEKQPRILGVTHDTMYTFAAHCWNQAVKVRARNNILNRHRRRPLFSHIKLLADL